MKGPRYAQRVDDNQLEIVRELEQIPGVTVEVIGKPLDLLIGYRKMNFLVEVKRPDKAHRASAITDAQTKFLRRWTGQARIATSTEEILKLLKEGYKHAKSK
jgi:hypothetical protein